jgi:hypothetical protein
MGFGVGLVAVGRWGYLVLAVVLLFERLVNWVNQP